MSSEKDIKRTHKSIRKVITMETLFLLGGLGQRLIDFLTSLIGPGFDLAKAIIDLVKAVH